MIILGLTGSIGMGKTTAAAALRRLGMPAHDADRAVHRLLAPGGAAVREVLERFPGIGDGRGGVDRARLGRIVFTDAAALSRLEAILHPKVRLASRQFLRGCARRRVPVVVLDVPLLYEGGGDVGCDAVLVVTAPAVLQRQRVLSRPGMSEARLQGALARQLPDAEKRRRTRHRVQTGLGRRMSLLLLKHHLRSIRAAMTGRRRHAWSPGLRPRGASRAEK